jgi:hypothetical protein
VIHPSNPPNLELPLGEQTPRQFVARMEEQALCQAAIAFSHSQILHEQWSAIAAAATALRLTLTPSGVAPPT